MSALQLMMARARMNHLGTLPPLDTNIALDADVLTSGGALLSGHNDKTIVTNGVINTTEYLAYQAGYVAHSVWVDLGESYLINNIVVFHYFADGRTYHHAKTAVSTDNENYTNIFDSDVSGEYAETSSGHSITFPLRAVRYIRDTVNGSTANAYSHWVEIQAFRRTQE